MFKNPLFRVPLATFVFIVAFKMAFWAYWLFLWMVYGDKTWGNLAYLIWPVALLIAGLAAKYVLRDIKAMLQEIMPVFQILLILSVFSIIILTIFVPPIKQLIGEIAGDTALEAVRHHLDTVYPDEETQKFSLHEISPKIAPSEKRANYASYVVINGEEEIGKVTVKRHLFKWWKITDWGPGPEMVQEMEEKSRGPIPKPKPTVFNIQPKTTTLDISQTVSISGKNLKRPGDKLEIMNTEGEQLQAKIFWRKNQIIFYPISHRDNGFDLPYSVKLISADGEKPLTLFTFSLKTPTLIKRRQHIAQQTTVPPDNSAMFITRIEPNPAILGQKLTIHGQNLGRRENGTLSMLIPYLRPIAPDVLEWTDNYVVILIPRDDQFMLNYPYNFFINRIDGQQKSNNLLFTFGE